MNKVYGICVTSNIIDELNVDRSLKQLELVQIVYLNEQIGKCSIKLLSENTTTIKFNNHIYSCDFKQIQVIPHNLFLFLISADYDSRLNILKNEKEILDLKIDSKVTLKFIDLDKRAYAIEFVINYIGAIQKLGVGNFIGLNFAYFGRLREFGVILTKIHKKFHHECDEVTSIIIVRVEQLFCDILLSEKTNTETIQATQLQSPDDVEPSFFNGFRNKLVLKDLDAEKLGKNITETCLGCDKSIKLFKFPCGDPFCYWCILKRLGDIKRNSSTMCPNCSTVLHLYEENQFSKFLDVNLNEEEKLKSNVSYEYSKKVNTKIDNNNTSSTHNNVLPPKNDDLANSICRQASGQSLVTNNNTSFARGDFENPTWRRPSNQSIIHDSTSSKLALLPKNNNLDNSTWRRPVNQSNIRNSASSKLVLSSKNTNMDNSTWRRTSNLSSTSYTSVLAPKNDCDRNDFDNSTWRRPLSQSNILNDTSSSKSSKLVLSSKNTNMDNSTWRRASNLSSTSYTSVLAPKNDCNRNNFDNSTWRRPVNRPLKTNIHSNKSSRNTPKFHYGSTDIIIENVDDLMF